MAQRVKNKPELKIVVSNTPEVPAVEVAPEQVEMPFAIVNGEPVTQMPKDLYIPPQAMEVFLEAFEGPLDLLLYLIRRQNLNILDIPLAEITRQYMQYIEVMTELQLELAGEYMVMAATLAEIKSRMLLPRPKVDPDGKEEDPRAELVRRLQEYERFKQAAESIDTLPRLERDVWQTSAELKDRSVVRLLPTVTLQEMLLAFKDVVVRSEMFAHHHISRERLSVRARMSDVLTQLEQASFVEFTRLFRLEEGRMGVTVTFMALLELVREGLIEIVQAVPFAPLHVRAAGASRRLHLVGGNDALADGTVVGDTTTMGVGDAAVVGDAVVAPGPAVGLLLPTDGGLDNIVEEMLDPDFVDEDFDEDEEPLEGVDDVVARGAAPDEPAVPDDLAAPGEPAEPAAPAELTALGELADVAAHPADSQAGLAEADMAAGVAGAIELIDVLAAPDREVGLTNTRAGNDPSAAHVASLADLNLEPLQVTDEWTGSIDPAALAGASPDPAVLGPSSIHGTADFQTSTPNDMVAGVDLPPSAATPGQPAAAADAITSAVESVLVASTAENSLPTADLVQESIGAQQPSAYEVAAVDFAASLSSSSDAVSGSAAALDEAGAIVESVSAVGDLPGSVEPASTVAEVTLAAHVDGGSQPPLASREMSAGGAAEPVADVPFVGEQIVVEPVAAAATAGFDVPASSAEPAVASATSDHDIAVTFDPSMTPPAATAPAASLAVADEASFNEVSVASSQTAVSGESVPTPIDQPSANNDVGVAVDPAVSVPPIVPSESVSSAETPLDQAPPLDVEYESSEEAVAAGEQQPAPNEDVSLVGDTSVAGEASFVGDESLSGGPAVDVEEFAFDELPALDDAEPADQQPASGAEEVVNKVSDADEPPAPGEESDD